MRVTVKHVGGMAFEGRGHSGEAVKISSSSAVSEHLGASPMELLLMGVAGCSGMDIVSILEKMRVRLPEEKISRAIELSFDKYCSVIHTVNKVARVSYSLELYS